MPELGERLDGAERRLERVETGVNDLRKEVNGLRILGEKNLSDIKKMAEVQSHLGERLDDHGQKLDAILKALEPLSDMQDFIRRIAPDHEHRLRALEKPRGISR